MPENSRVAFHQKSAEIAVAALFFIVGAVVVYDSLRLGAAWGPDGPRPGYFPFYVGLLICIASAANLVRGALLRGEQNKPFVFVHQLKLVLAVLVPTAAFAALVTWIGMYAAAVLFIGFFMRALGKYAWWKVIAVSVGAAVVFYCIFELWFQVPLPKGPVEALLRLN